MTQGNGSRTAVSNRETKNSAFITYFSEPENASQLYAALGDGEVSPEDITYVTLEGVLFIARKNDLAFTVKNRILVISEHQSTINENMPLRDLLYLGRTLEKLLDERSIYKRTLLKIPTPQFFVFYNGNDPYPAEKILRLSDAYLEKTEQPMLELTVKVININFSSEPKFLQECRPMYEYSWFIQRIKDYQTQGWCRDAAVTQAVKDCLEEGILVEFMKKHGSEVVNMLYTQWNWDDAMAVEREEAYAEGLTQGISQGIAQGESLGERKGDLMRYHQNILDLLEELGEVPEDIRACIQAQENPDILRIWHKAAAHAQSLADFRKTLQQV
ncbi:MAG: Rpn family recombination-promoting nuclease/putative transposase [bacterium]|nr:Rpn family recombination-promoting nuclease/putative transposase [bacterium]